MTRTATQASEFELEPRRYETHPALNTQVYEVTSEALLRSAGIPVERSVGVQRLTCGATRRENGEHPEV